ncbi:hypothetical protein HID58_055394 [Brassica napus]|uniref:Uncharacterized protein n=1 Tax=Brassica napus TaxID=3708 RepID=A0ABQ8AKA8_BRANA|nr:hypothetical protein HID58_055394 [Brassica napus]
MLVLKGLSVRAAVSWKASRAARGRLWVRYHSRDAVCSDTRKREETMVDWNLNFAHDVETVTEEEIVIPVD